MKATYKTKSGRLMFEVTGETAKDLFSSVAAIQDLFEAESNCGVCQGDDLRFQMREVDDYKFYELVCRKPGCYARFGFGQAKKGGGLFPKRKDAAGKPLPNRGWEKYVKPGSSQANGQRTPDSQEQDWDAPYGGQ